MGFKNVIQDLKKKNFANSQLVELEKKTEKLFDKINVKDKVVDIDLIKNEMEFILLERKTIFSFTGELELIDEDDGILKKIRKISEVLKADGKENKEQVISLLRELEIHFNENQISEIDEEFVSNHLKLIEDTLKLNSFNFNHNYIDKYEFKISGRQYITFLNSISNIAKGNMKEATHSLREFIENYNMTIDEPFWVYERVLIKSMIDGIRERIQSLLK